VKAASEAISESRRDLADETLRFVHYSAGRPTDVGIQNRSFTPP
jgi:hypothetical protein